MERPLHRRLIPLLSISLITILGISRTSGFEEIRLVQAVSLFASGLCAGAALAIFIGSRRDKTTSV